MFQLFLYFGYYEPYPKHVLPKLIYQFGIT
jgi:hypothetical protein